MAAKMFAQLQHSGRLQCQGTTTLMPVGASSLPNPSNPIEVQELTVEKFRSYSKICGRCFTCTKSRF